MASATSGIESATEYELALARRTRSQPKGLVSQDPPRRYERDVRGPARDRVLVPLLPNIRAKDLRLGIRRPDDETSSDRGVAYSDLSDFLLLSAGLKGGRTGLVWNRPVDVLARGRLKFVRGAASGGGLYPWTMHVVAMNVENLEPGLYGYDVTHHALGRYWAGNLFAALRAPIGYREGGAPDLVVVLTAEFWLSARKYGRFAYKVIMQDVGAVLGQIEQVAYGLGWETRFIHRFDDAAVADLLDLNMVEEAPFAVVTANGRASELRQHTGHTAKAERLECAQVPKRKPPIGAPCGDTAVDEFIPRIHASTVVAEAGLREGGAPGAERSVPGKDWGSLIGGDLTKMVMRRETSWGRIRREPRVSAATLERVLSFGVHGVEYRSDLYNDHAELSLVRAFALVRSAKDIIDGVYELTRGRLVQRSVGWLTPDVESLFLRKSHDVDQVPVVLVLVGALSVAVARYGQRGVRIMNAEAGIFAQRAYLACAALTLGTGAILGFDAQRVGEWLGVDCEREVPLLLMMLGAQAPQPLAYDFRLF